MNKRIKRFYKMRMIDIPLHYHTYYYSFLNSYEYIYNHFWASSELCDFSRKYESHKESFDSYHDYQFLSPFYPMEKE